LNRLDRDVAHAPMRAQPSFDLVAFADIDGCLTVRY
jgi:hypothetical protein